MRQFKSGFSFVMPDETGFFYSLIILYTILGQNSSFRDRRNKIYFVRKFRNFYFVRKMKNLFRRENVLCKNENFVS